MSDEDWPPMVKPNPWVDPRYPPATALPVWHADEHRPDMPWEQTESRLDFLERTQPAEHRNRCDCGHFHARGDEGEDAGCPRCHDHHDWDQTALAGLRVDRAGFTRRWGVHVFVDRGAPWLSLGLHFDWHTPTLDLYLGRATVQIGRNQWDAEGRFAFLSQRHGPHTDQCIHFRLVRDAGGGSHTEEATRD